MKWNRFIISICLMLTSASVMADSIYVEKRSESKYDKRIHRYRKNWASLIPTQFIVQNAGNMGNL